MNIKKCCCPKFYNYIVYFHIKVIGKKTQFYLNTSFDEITKINNCPFCGKDLKEMK